MTKLGSRGSTNAFISSGPNNIPSLSDSYAFGSDDSHTAAIPQGGSLVVTGASNGIVTNQGALQMKKAWTDTGASHTQSWGR